MEFDQLCYHSVRSFPDADCGRGYTLIEDHCYNVSDKAMPMSEAAPICAQSSGVPLSTLTKKAFFYIRVTQTNASGLDFTTAVLIKRAIVTIYG